MSAARPRITKSGLFTPLTPYYVSLHMGTPIEEYRKKEARKLIIIPMNIKNFLWMTPFLSFFIGYMSMLKIMHTPEVIVPNLIGKHVHTILPTITNYSLNIRLLDQKEEPDLPEGIILNQTPAGGTLVKQNQPLFVVTTKKPISIQAPHCIGIHSDALSSELAKQNIDFRMYYLSHAYPDKICFAQSPQSGEPLEKNKLILYVSSGNNKPIVWPDFNQQPLDDVINFLEVHHIPSQIINDYEHICYAHNELIVIDQRPIAGTLLTIDEHKPLSVQLRVRPYH